MYKKAGLDHFTIRCFSVHERHSADSGLMLRFPRLSLPLYVAPGSNARAEAQHTCCAIPMLRQGASLQEISTLLRHCSIETTQIYARANLEMKRKALEKISDPSAVPSIPSWQQNKNLLDWLRSL